MLTVKHVGADGGEHIYEATEVQVSRIGEGGVNVTPVDIDATNIFYPFPSAGEPRPAEGPDPKLYVMNRHGATVSTYNL